MNLFGARAPSSNGEFGARANCKSDDRIAIIAIPKTIKIAGILFCKR